MDHFNRFPFQNLGAEPPVPDRVNGGTIELVRGRLDYGALMNPSILSDHIADNETSFTEA